MCCNCDGIDCHAWRAIDLEKLLGFAWILNTQCSLVDGFPIQMVHETQFVDFLVAAEVRDCLPPQQVQSSRSRRGNDG